VFMHTILLTSSSLEHLQGVLAVFSLLVGRLQLFFETSLPSRNKPTRGQAGGRKRDGLALSDREWGIS
jgi:hypothetical protein